MIYTVGGKNLNLIISNRSDQPIYEQIKTQFITAIIQGKLIEGQVLPSIRSLATDLKISVITTKRAYDELENEGYITAAAGKGFFVLPRNENRIKEMKLQDIESSLKDAISNAKFIGLTNEELKEVLDILLEEKEV